MSFLITYGQWLIESITSLKFYAQVLKNSWWRSLAFVVVTVMLTSMIPVIRFINVVLPSWQSGIHQTLRDASQNFPNDMTISWDGQQIGVKPNQPYMLSYPSTIKPGDYQLPPNLAFYTPDASQASQLKTSVNALAILTPKEAIVNDLQGKWENVAWSELLATLPSQTITHQNIIQATQNFQTQVDQVFSSLPLAIVVLAPFLAFFFLIWTSLIDALIVYFLVRLQRLPLSFKKSWQLALHLIVVAQIIQTLGSLLYPSLTWPLFSLTFWIVFFLILLTQKSSLREVVTASQTRA